MKRLFYSIGLCFIICFLFKSQSYAVETSHTVSFSYTRNTGLNYWLRYVQVMHYTGDDRLFALLKVDNGVTSEYPYAYRLYSNQSVSCSGNVSTYAYSNATNERDPSHDGYSDDVHYFVSPASITTGVWANSNNSADFRSISPLVSSDVPIFNNYQNMIDYLSSGGASYDETLKLDNFYCWDYGLDDASSPDYVVPEYTTGYKATWSDSRIATVRVRIDSTSLTEDFLSQSSPFVGYFRANNYANLNGDVINIIATPYTSNGTYGQSMYCTFTYDGNNPLTNIFRKLFKNEHYNNIIEIPYNGNEETYDVDGVATNTTYVVHYDPIFNRFYDSRVYEINYSPVIVYPSETPSTEITETQNYITNNYITNNYNTIYNNLNLDFDFNFGDVSTGDIEQMYDDTTGMISMIGTLFGLIGTLFAACFPFLMFDIPGWLLFFGGLFLVAAGIGLFIKIVSFFRG